MALKGCLASNEKQLNAIIGDAEMSRKRREQRYKERQEISQVAESLIGSILLRGDPVEFGRGQPIATAVLPSDCGASAKKQRLACEVVVRRHPFIKAGP
jgi:small nuclear ribonucleoprotein (snRNP)-like protein